MNTTRQYTIPGDATHVLSRKDAGFIQRQGEHQTQRQCIPVHKFWARGVAETADISMSTPAEYSFAQQEHTRPSLWRMPTICHHISCTTTVGAENYCCCFERRIFKGIQNSFIRSGKNSPADYARWCVQGKTPPAVRRQPENSQNCCLENQVLIECYSVLQDASPVAI